uniref:Uncharacterized protein n=1 Tax=Arundo donax TaxID=35708 RepID=A0A0A9DNU6_ARUDO
MVKEVSVQYSGYMVQIHSCPLIRLLKFFFQLQRKATLSVFIHRQMNWRK